MRLLDFNNDDMGVSIFRDVREDRDWSRPWADPPGWFPCGCCKCPSKFNPNTQFYEFQIPTRADNTCSNCSSGAGTWIGLMPTGPCTWVNCNSAADASCTTGSFSATMTVVGTNVKLTICGAAETTPGGPRAVCGIYTAPVSTWSTSGPNTMTFSSQTGFGCTWSGTVTVYPSDGTICGSAYYYHAYYGGGGGVTIACCSGKTMKTTLAGSIATDCSSRWTCPSMTLTHSVWAAGLTVCGFTPGTASNVWQGTSSSGGVDCSVLLACADGGWVMCATATDHATFFCQISSTAGGTLTINCNPFMATLSGTTSSGGLPCGCKLLPTTITVTE